MEYVSSRDIPDSELTEEEMEELNIRMSYFTSSGSGAAMAAAGFGAIIAGLAGFILPGKVGRMGGEKDYNKQYEKERNRMKQLIVANRDIKNQITYQSLGCKKFINGVYEPINGDVSIADYRDELLQVVGTCGQIINDSDAIQAKANAPMQESDRIQRQRN